jgi:hypothetical protein
MRALRARPVPFARSRTRALGSNGHLMLFDLTERTDLEYASHSEGNFAYLNRSGCPETAAVRKVLEEWFARYRPVIETSCAPGCAREPVISSTRRFSNSTSINF